MPLKSTGSSECPAKPLDSEDDAKIIQAYEASTTTAAFEPMIEEAGGY
jgi:hypothetical protein